MSKKITTEDFIKKAKEIHGDKYDYSKTIYVKAKQKVIVTCSIHGDFQITPDSHVGNQRQGCKKCGVIKRVNKSRMTKEELITKANKIHNNKYDYSLVGEFKNNRDKIEIICPKHGKFKQIITNHLKGEGCNLCRYDSISKNRTLTNDEFKKKATAKHNNKFDYSMVEYIDMWTPINIVCPIHGIFNQSPVNHLNTKHGCQLCANDSISNLLSTRFEDFKMRAESKYGDKFEYDKETYVNIKTKIRIICPEHGEFWQLPHLHLSSITGCPYCGSELRSGENHYNYNSSLTDEDRITQRNIKENIKWRNNVFKRDNYTCVKCGKSHTELNAHHLNGWHWDISGRFDINNGQTLCSDNGCHELFHKIYGNKNNTKEQFEEFMKLELDIEDVD